MKIRNFIIALIISAVVRGVLPLPFYGWVNFGIQLLVLWFVYGFLAAWTEQEKLRHLTKFVTAEIEECKTKRSITDGEWNKLIASLDTLKVLAIEFNSPRYVAHAVHLYHTIKDIPRN
jgi:hypothetical protein